MLQTIVLAVAAATPGVASSQEVNCTCRQPAGTIASLVKAKGVVLVSRAAGFEPVGVGTTLPVGSRIIVGQESSTTIRLGKTCTIDLPENSEADVASDQQELCIAMSPTELPPAQNLAAGTSFLPAAPEYLFLGSAAGALVLSVFDEDKAVSD